MALLNHLPSDEWQATQARKSR